MASEASGKVFEETRLAAGEFLAKFCCHNKPQCTKTQVPENLFAGSCEHLFCSDCAEALKKRKQCPVCLVGCDPKDVKIHRHICELLELARRLHRVLEENQSTDGGLPPEMKPVDVSEHLAPSPFPPEPKGNRQLPLSLTPVHNTEKAPQKRQTRSVSASRRKSLSAVGTASARPKPDRASVPGGGRGRRASRRSEALQSPEQPRSSKRRSSSSKARGVGRNLKGETALHSACILGDGARVRHLLAVEQQNPNQVDNAGWTPLHEAASRGHCLVAQLLLDNGALVDAPADQFRTPLHDAVATKELDMVNLLLKHGADPLRMTMGKKTAMDLAAEEPMKAALRSVEKGRKRAEPRLERWCWDREPDFVYTSKITPAQRSLANKLTGRLGWQGDAYFTDLSTHILTTGTDSEDRECARTVKVLRGLLKGFWIVNFGWAKACLAAGSRVPEEDFEIQTLLCPSGVQQVHDAPRRSRLSRMCLEPGLFAGLHFFLMRHKFSGACPKRSDLELLIQLGDGDVLSREPSSSFVSSELGTLAFHATAESELGECSVFIVYSPDALPSSRELKTPPGVRLVSAMWLVDCIAAFRILKPY